MLALIIIGCIIGWFVCGLISARIWNVVTGDEEEEIYITLTIFGPLGLGAELLLILLGLIAVCLAACLRPFGPVFRKIVGLGR